jgi:hypothetical protein
VVRSERRDRDHEQETATSSDNDEFLHHRKPPLVSSLFAGTAYLRYQS